MEKSLQEPTMADNQAIERLLKLYKTVSLVSSLSKVRILNPTSKGALIHTTWTQRNLDRKINQRYSTMHSYNIKSNSCYNLMTSETTPERMCAFTEDGKRKAVIREVKTDNSTKQYIEIWDNQSLLKHYDVLAFELHGEIYTDDEFGSFDWSSDNTKLLYIAEKKQPKSEPFYIQLPQEKENKKDPKATRGTEYIYKPHWGEQLAGKYQPVVVILDMVEDRITVISEIPDNLSPAQVIWAGNKDIVGVAWEHGTLDEQRFGLVACTNRTSYIFLLKDGVYYQLSENGCAVHSPRLSPCGNYLIWLERKAGGAHHNAHRLMLRYLKDEKKQEPEILIDIVKTDMTINNNAKFYGIYGSLPRHCWSNDCRYIFFSTPQESTISSYILDIRTKIVTEIQKYVEVSLSIMDVKHNIIAFVDTSLKEPPTLEIGHFENENANSGDIYRFPVTHPLKIDKFNDFIFSVNRYTYDNDDEIRRFNFIYFGPYFGENASIPLIVIPHGGPHSNFVNSFSMNYALFALAGFAIIFVNYRGSTGMGSACVEYLQGKIGKIDVEDCVTATKEILKQYSWLDPNRVALYGGSHGGFLVAHLSGQYPDMYKAVIAKNPVIDIAAMFVSSDIPDWCAAEVNERYEDAEGVTDIGIYNKMMKHSPIMYVNTVKAPTLICIGLNDLRVPPNQGKLWYNRLKSRHVKTKLLVYEDNHRLSTGPVEIDHILNDCLWLFENMSINNIGKHEKKVE